MSYQVFQSRVLSLLEKSNSGLSVNFNNEDGKFMANFSDGTRIIGNPVSNKVTIRWGSGHQANTEI